MPEGMGYPSYGNGGSKTSDSLKNDKSMSAKELGVRYREANWESPQESGLGSTGPNQVPVGVPEMKGNRKGTGSSKI